MQHTIKSLEKVVRSGLPVRDYWVGLLHFVMQEMVLAAERYGWSPDTDDMVMRKDIEWFASNAIKKGLLFGCTKSDIVFASFCSWMFDQTPSIWESACDLPATKGYAKYVKFAIVEWLSTQSKWTKLTGHSVRFAGVRSLGGKHTSARCAWGKATGSFAVVTIIENTRPVYQASAPTARQAYHKINRFIRLREREIKQSDLTNSHKMLARMVGVTMGNGTLFISEVQRVNGQLVLV